MSNREEKAAIRTEALARRDAIPPEMRVQFSLDAAGHGLKLVEFDPGAIISAFLPIRSEIDARPLMDGLKRRGARLCLPVVIDRQTIVFRELVQGSELVSTGFGTVGPGPSAAVLDPEIMIMPLAAFDVSGNRIGYGAGHYDRAIARLEERGSLPQRIGFAYSAQQVAKIPAEPHDRPMDAMITETGAIDFRS